MSNVEVKQKTELKNVQFPMSKRIGREKDNR
jgi:hypothetical protein